ncbi:hypothetical protein CARUB_v10006811mg [Capsella rubella]|uniref:S-protein homolog n=1 Tax=Capsella rubella TaxID=81985 RepID=R0H441_9BRAS|nr:hypothetical protein CARUB_v10006811mg [Capsella rubella]
MRFMATCYRLCEGSLKDIINDIGPNVQLVLRCKEKNRDLGSHTLSPSPIVQHNGFRGTINFWDKTLFFCHFEWGNKDTDICKHHQPCPCVWSIRPSGPCRLTGHET